MDFNLDKLEFQCDECHTTENLGITNTNWTFCKECAIKTDCFHRWKSEEDMRDSKDSGGAE